MAKLGENPTLPIDEDTTVINVMLGQFFSGSLNLHFRRIKNGTTDELIPQDGGACGNPGINLDCNPEAAEKEFLAVVQKSDNYTQEAFKRCTSKGDISKTWLHLPS